MTWGQDDYAVTFGSPQLSVMYRADIFDALDLAAPTTWQEYAELARLLDDPAKLGELNPPADQPWSGVAEPRGPGWGGQLLLARAAAYTRHPRRYSTLFQISSMEPLIHSEPFVKALTELVEANKYGVDEPDDLSPTDAYRALLDGRCAMAIGWPSDVAFAADETPATRLSIRFAELPGSAEVYNFTNSTWEARRAGDDHHVPLLNVDGRIGSVTRESPRRRAAQQFLIWLTSQRNSAAISPRSIHTTMFRSSHTSNPEPWAGAQLDAAGAASYGDLIRQVNQRRIWFYSPRIPGREEYLAALDKAVAEAIAEQSPQDVLRRASQQWNAINARRGVEQQRQCYEESLRVGA